MKNTVSADRLRELFRYDPSTGVFLNRKGRVMGSTHSGGYLVSWIDGKLYFNHRLAFLYMHGEFPTQGVDHINGNKTDNRIENLRVATKIENGQNRKWPSKANTSGYLGVSFHKQRKKWSARITADNAYKSLGLFDTKEAAHEAYIQAKKIFHPFYSPVTTTSGAPKQ